MEPNRNTGADTTMDRPAGRTMLFWLVAGAIIAAIGLLAAGMLVGAGGGDHAKFHVFLALLALVPAGILVARSGRPTVASRAPAIGFWLLAGAQLVEGLGALGYGADGYSRKNDLVVLHDLGLTLAPIGFVGAAIGMAIGIGSLVGRRSGRPRLAAGVTALVAVVGVFGVAKLIGL